ncbi:MAG: PEP-CTERM sorting domain-containing protein [Cyanobacteriota bacterium]|nr:PEP-CTERM sorting domain-containing protein [Cyanobacteriota bacterium]
MSLRKIRVTQIPIHRFSSLSQAVLVAIASTCGIGVKTALADPPPEPPPLTVLPPVFCFRFTDIKAVEDDPEGDKFQLAFEVLNWSNQPAAGVRIAMTEGTNTFVTDGAAPTFAGAGIDSNGRPNGPDGDPLPGNQQFINTGQVTQSTETAIQWDAVQSNFNTLVSGPIPNRDLLGVGPRNTPGGCALVPGCQLQGPTNPVVADWETVDNGNNVLDGFVVTVDDIDEGEVISFNWNLLDVNGNPIGMPGGIGNDYGFGAVNIARIPISGDPDSDFRIFEQNTGVERSNRLFAENSHMVTEYSPVDYDTQINGGLSALNAVATETAADGEVIAKFAAEFGAGIAGQFLNPEDNIFGSTVNAQLVDYPEPTPTPDPSPSPSPDPDPSPSPSPDPDPSPSPSPDPDPSPSPSPDPDPSPSPSPDPNPTPPDDSVPNPQPESVPEPSAMAMLGMTAIALFGYKRQRRS